MLLLKKHITAIFVCLLLSVQVFAQSDSDSLNTTENTLHRPNLELGVGALTYYGDIGNLNGISQSYQLNWGYNLTLSNPISDAFGVNLFAFMGKIRANERLLDQDVNFESKIRMGGVSVTYNFNHFLPEKRNISPYLSVGFSTYEYSSKSDLLDANGNAYHYWNDGTVRLMDQSDPLATEDTPLLKRDYVYETDLRQDSENQGSYNLRSFTVPVGIGANLQMTEAFTLRMGTEFHFGLSDDLDGISDNSEHGGGKKGNDHFMYTSLGVSYNLQFKKKEEPISFEDESNAILIEYEDQDGDGVSDIVDLCPNTPEGIAVGEFGCPWDTDGDGVADYLDLDPKSKKGVAVNMDGVEITDDEIFEIYDRYVDGSGHMSYDKSATYTADIIRRNVSVGSRDKGFRVMINHGAEMTNEEFAQLLSVRDIKAEETENGNRYYLGYYETLEEAIQNRPYLEAFETEIQFNNFGDVTTIAENEIAMIAENVLMLDIDPNQVVFRVQIGAYKYKLSKNVFSELPGLLIMEGSDGLTRYVAGSFGSIKEAAAYKVDLLLKGFEGAFVTAYKGGERITLKEAGATTNAKEDISNEKETGKIDKSLVHFTVQLDAFDGRVPAEVLGKFMTLGGVKPHRSENTTKYVSGTFNTIQDAETALSEMKEKGFENAKIVGNFNGTIIDADEATKIMND